MEDFLVEAKRRRKEQRQELAAFLTKSMVDESYSILTALSLSPVSPYFISLELIVLRMRVILHWLSITFTQSFSS